MTLRDVYNLQKRANWGLLLGTKLRLNFTSRYFILDTTGYVDTEKRTETYTYFTAAVSSDFHLPACMLEVDSS